MEEVAGKTVYQLKDEYRPVFQEQLKAERMQQQLMTHIFGLILKHGNNARNLQHQNLLNLTKQMLNFIKKMQQIILHL